MKSTGVAVAVAVALVSGVALACQVGVNSELRRRAGDPLLAAFLSFLIGGVLLGVVVALRRPAWPSPGLAAGWPWWAWLGGVLGAGYVTAAAALAHRVGAAGWLATVVAGQILASLALDHFGWVGFAPVPLTPRRLAGAILLVVGVALVLRR